MKTFEYAGVTGRRIVVNLEAIIKIIEQDTGVLVTFANGTKEYLSAPYDELLKAWEEDNA